MSGPDICKHMVPIDRRCEECEGAAKDDRSSKSTVPSEETQTAPNSSSPASKVLNGIRDKILARLKNPAPHAAELREQALDLANDEYNKLRKNLGYPPLDNKGRWIFEAERAKLESGE